MMLRGSSFVKISFVLHMIARSPGQQYAIICIDISKEFHCSQHYSFVLRNQNSQNPIVHVDGLYVEIDL
jgi:hypothetical protein